MVPWLKMDWASGCIDELHGLGQMAIGACQIVLAIRETDVALWYELMSLLFELLSLLRHIDYEPYPIVSHFMMALF